MDKVKHILISISVIFLLNGCLNFPDLDGLADKYINKWKDEQNKGRGKQRNFPGTPETFSSHDKPIVMGKVANSAPSTDCVIASNAVCEPEKTIEGEIKALERFIQPLKKEFPSLLAGRVSFFYDDIHHLLFSENFSLAVQNMEGADSIFETSIDDTKILPNRLLKLLSRKDRSIPENTKTRIQDLIMNFLLITPAYYAQWAEPDPHSQPQLLKSVEYTGTAETQSIVYWRRISFYYLDQVIYQDTFVDSKLREHGLAQKYISLYNSISVGNAVNLEEAKELFDKYRFWALLDGARQLLKVKTS